MRRLARLTAVLLGSLPLLAAVPAAAQLQEPDFTVRSEQLAGGLYVLIGRGGNIGVSTGPDGTVLIDDQFAAAAPAINAALRELGASPVRFVLNTHWHGDHTGGNEPFAGSGAVLLAHDNVRVRMSAAHTSRFLGNATPASPAVALPVITFGETASLHLNGGRVRVLHTPRAHTDGDAIVQFGDANVLHAGDLFFNGLYPFIDGDSGGSVEGLIGAVDTLLALADDETRIIPGHGPLADRKALQAYRDMLVETSGRVRKLLDDGLSVEQVIAAAPNADYDATWSWTFINAERYLRMLAGLIGQQAN